MAVRIIQIAPKPNTSTPKDAVSTHATILNFKWVNEETSQVGVSTLETMFEWIVNKKGQAYVKIDENTTKIPVLGAISPSGKKYLRCVNNSKWSDELLSLSEIIA